MSEEPRPQPKLDRVREALRERDEQQSDEAPQPADSGDRGEDEEAA